MINDIIQLGPSHALGRALIIVEEVKSWGVCGYVIWPHHFDLITVDGKAYVRVCNGDFEIVGKLKWPQEPLISTS